jgi:predicted HNH restriction endonuclease
MKCYPPNETQETIIKRIKRYKKIVDELKKKYNGYCQVENCEFTFSKIDGENYSEAHHLMSLAKGGSQNQENVAILCANHHRMFHYAKVEIKEMQSKYKRRIFINNEELFLIYKE